MLLYQKYREQATLTQAYKAPAFPLGGFLTFVLIEYQKESDSGVLPSLKNTFQCLTAFFDN